MVDAVTDGNAEDEKQCLGLETATTVRESHVDEVEAGIGPGVNFKGEREREGDSSQKGDVKNCTEDEKEMKFKEEIKGEERDRKGLKGTKKKVGEGEGDGQGHNLSGIVLDVVLLGAPICSTVRRYNNILL